MNECLNMSSIKEAIILWVEGRFLYIGRVIWSAPGAPLMFMWAMARLTSRGDTRSSGGVSLFQQSFSVNWRILFLVASSVGPPIPRYGVAGLIGVVHSGGRCLVVMWVAKTLALLVMSATGMPLIRSGENACHLPGCFFLSSCLARNR